MRKKKKKKIVKLVSAIAVVFGAILFCLCENNTNKNTSNSSSSQSQPQEMVDPSMLYSSWTQCVDYQIIPRRSVGIGQDVVVTNICSHKISKVILTVYADGRSVNTEYYDIAPGKKQSNLISVMADAYLVVTNVLVVF